jgi:quercetin dioxygenase-like cupin family protein
MGTFRMFTGADGKARVEPIDLERTPAWTKGLAAKEISFRVWPIGETHDWHPAPRRQFVIILSGGLEIGFEDGSTHRFGPGDARLVEDTTGKGHTTRVVGNEPCVTAAIPLA